MVISVDTILLPHAAQRPCIWYLRPDYLTSQTRHIQFANFRRSSWYSVSSRVCADPITFRAPYCVSSTPICLICPAQQSTGHRKKEQRTSAATGAFERWGFSVNSVSKRDWRRYRSSRCRNISSPLPHGVSVRVLNWPFLHTSVGLARDPYASASCASARW